MRTFAGRAYLFLNMLFRDRAGKRVLVVTHRGTLRGFRFLLERWTFDEVAGVRDSCRTPNCCVTTYRFDASTSRMRLEALSEIYGDWESLPG